MALILRYFTGAMRNSGWRCRRKKFTFTISSDEFLVIYLLDSNVMNLMVLKKASAKCVIACLCLLETFRRQSSQEPNLSIYAVFDLTKCRKIYWVSVCITKTNIDSWVLLVPQTSDRNSQHCKFVTFWFLRGILQLLLTRRPGKGQIPLRYPSRRPGCRPVCLRAIWVLQAGQKLVESQLRTGQRLGSSYLDMAK